MAEFLENLCITCSACPNLITLDPGPEQCDNCATISIKRKIKDEPSSPSVISPKRSAFYDEVTAASSTTPAESFTPSSSTGLFLLKKDK